MNLPKTAQIIKYCGLFLILLFFLSVDLAAILTVSLFLALHSRNYTKLLVISLILFTADIILKYFDISIRFISDMMLDSYILLLTSLFLYSKSQKKIVEYLEKLGNNSRKALSINTLTMLGISSIFSLLLAPIIGISFAVVGGYIAFSYLSKHFEGRYAYVAGLVFLFFSPFFIIAGKDSISENFAIISFFFLIIGTIQEVINTVKISNLSFSPNIKQPSFVRPSKISLPIKARWLFGILLFVVISGLVYFLIYSKKLNIPNLNFFPKPSIPAALPTEIITPANLPTVIPTPFAKVSSDTARLRIYIQNGTDIKGLASTTAAVLRQVGFSNIQTGNAVKNDYTDWQLATKINDANLIPLFKNILVLNSLSVREASIPAGFDILIIAGSRK